MDGIGWGGEGEREGRGDEGEGRGRERRGGEGLLNFHFIFKKPGQSRVIQASVYIYIHWKDIYVNTKIDR